MVVEVDIAVNHLVGFREGSRLVSVDVFCFEDSDILPSASLPFCELQKIPQQLVFHAQLPDLIGLLRCNISRQGVFPWPSFGPRKDP